MPRKPHTHPSLVTPRRIRLTARLSLPAYDAIAEIQRRYRHKTGSALPLWKVLDTAILTYALEQGVAVGE